MSDIIRIDVCMAEDPKELRRLVAASKNFWKGAGFLPINSLDLNGPDSINVHEGSIGADGLYREGDLLYDREAVDNAVVLIFLKR